jgi:hypothetical protein
MLVMHLIEFIDATDLGLQWMCTPLSAITSAPASIFPWSSSRLLTEQVSPHDVVPVPLT